MPDSAPAYEKRLVFFVDFLAFKEHVDRTEVEPAFLGTILNAMDRVAELVADDVAIRRSQQVTQFSDCMVVSYRVDEESAVFWLLDAIATCVIDLVGRGFLLRGAVTVGDLYHTEKHVVGPALVKAHQLESKAAIYPRILIDEEEEYVRSFTTQDEDGQLYIDYFTADSVVDVVGTDLYFYPSYVRSLSEIVAKGLAHDDPGVAKKYLWLYRKYLTAIDRVLSVPDGHESREIHEEIFLDLEALPRFVVEVEAATARVAAAEAEKAKKAG